ncbi:MAG TPA: anti-sigma factor [Nitrososphaeraceae archaeon]|jgi:hypothetical protein|nr:anti-sigma factor [Nitrososphaeraceae archaeon]
MKFIEKFVAFSLAAFLVVLISSIATSSFLLIQIAEAQQRNGNLTTPSNGNPFGGEKKGTITLNTDGYTANISAKMDSSPTNGKVFEGWLVDAGGSGYQLSLGQFNPDGTLTFKQYMVNPYTYKQFVVTEEPADDPDPNAASAIAGFELQNPFGK